MRKFTPPKLGKFKPPFSLLHHKVVLNHAIATTTGVNHPRTSWKRLSKLEIPLPPLPEQKRIAAVLSAVQDAREKTDAVIRATRELKKSMMRHLFTYGPVPPGEADSVPLKETEIGMVPEGWDVVRLIDLADDNSDIVGGPFGSNLKVSDYKSTGIPIIRLQNIERDQFIHKNIKYISEEKAEELKYHSFIRGDIVLAKLGDPIGKTCIVPNSIEKGIVTADVVRIRTLLDRTYKEYIVYSLNSESCTEQFRREKTGTTRPRVNVTNVRNVKIPFPPLPEQKSIAAMLLSVDNKILAEENKKKVLDDLFKTLLNDLMIAKVRVNHLNLEVGL